MSNLYAILIIHLVQPLPPFYNYVGVKWALAIHTDLRKYVIEISQALSHVAPPVHERGDVLE